MLIAISESRRPRRNSVRYPVNAGLRQSLATHPASGERPRNFTCVISSGCRGSNPTLSNAASTCSRVTTKFAFAMKTSPAPKSDHASDQYDQRRRDNSSCHRAGRGNLGEAAVKLTSALLQFAGRKLPKEGSLGGQQRLDEPCRFFAYPDVLRFFGGSPHRRERQTICAFAWTSHSETIFPSTCSNRDIQLAA
jgi:hypothetical protein